MNELPGEPASELPDSLKEVEAMIAAAAGYVVPGDNLRPRVLEVARLRQSQMRSAWRMFQVAAVVFLCVLITIPAQQQLEAWRKTAFAPSASELEFRAQQYADQPSIGQHWGLYEAFKDLRHNQMLKISGQ